MKNTIGKVSKINVIKEIQQFPKRTPGAEMKDLYKF